MVFFLYIFHLISSLNPMKPLVAIKPSVNVFFLKIVPKYKCKICLYLQSFLELSNLIARETVQIIHFLFYTCKSTLSDSLLLI